MRLVFLVLVGIFSTTLAYSNSPEYFNKVVDAIGKAENSAKYPYGIKSIPTYGDKKLARKYCYNTVRNNWKRWELAGCPGTFIDFLSKRYCPIGAKDDPTGLNKHWKKNVEHFINDRR